MSAPLASSRLSASWERGQTLVPLLGGVFGLERPHGTAPSVFSAILRGSMPQENVEVVRRLFAAFDGEDWQAALDLFDPAVEWSPTEGTYYGPEGVVSSLVEWFEPWEEHDVELDEVTNAGDQVLAVVRLTGRGAQSGAEIDQRFFQVYALRSGKIIRMAEFVTRDEALEAAQVPG